MSEYVCKIERLQNGYEVEISDPVIVKANKAKDSKWRDPEVCYAFKTVDEVLTFLGKTLDKALPMDEYDSSFSDALTETEDE